VLDALAKELPPAVDHASPSGTLPHGT